MTTHCPHLSGEFLKQGKKANGIRTICLRGLFNLCYPLIYVFFAVFSMVIYGIKLLSELTQIGGKDTN